jgi:hypothetical protein
MFAILEWMLPSLNVTELAGFLSSMKGTAPPPVMKAVSDLCTARIEPARWDAVRLRIGL